MRPYSRPSAGVLLRGILFCALVFSLGCQKELHYDVDPPTYTGGGSPGSSGTAVFALVPSGNNCSDATASGSFEAGTALTPASFVIVTVNVSKIGSWALTTGSVNGFTLSGTGVFTTTGSQVIVLLATGTPAAAGTSSFPLNIGGTTCSVSITVTAAGSGVGNADIYYKATIDGTNYSQAVTASNGYEAGSGLGGSDDVAIGGGINYANPPLPPGGTEMGVDKGLMHHYLSSTNAQFKAFFPVGACVYAPPSATEFGGGDGVVVVWTDPTGNYWSSHAGTGDQTGSSFNIISVVDAPDVTGTYYIKVKMQFSCKLYNVNTGAVKQLTNGEMVAYFGKI